jgi:large repetitive protein
MKILLATLFAALSVVGSPSVHGAQDAEDVPVAQVAACDVSGATLTWGFKESFRSYITSSIANGKWDVTDGATYATPNFAWSESTGRYDPATANGRLNFAGQIEFTGHGGVLDTTVANPRLSFDQTTLARLYLDVAGTTQQGKPIKEDAVEFVVLDLAEATITRAGGTVTVEHAPARLTPAGAHAFGTYRPEEKFDPVSLQFTLASPCAKAFVANERSAEGRPGRIAFVIAIVAVFVLVIGTVTFVLVRRRRKKRRAV